MRAIIGNMEADVTADGRSVEFAPPQGAQTSLHLQMFEATGAPLARKAAGGGADISTAAVMVHPGTRAADLVQGAGAALVVSAIAIALVMRRGLTKTVRAPADRAGKRRDHLEDDDAARIAFMKRYGGAS